MNLILLGDVVGRPGRDAVKAHLPALRRDLAIDIAVVNAENAAHGFGLTEKIAGELYIGAETPRRRRGGRGRGRGVQDGHPEADRGTAV